ncbi:MAG: DUF2804 domain-containing protein [Oscillospiraceae bacterium]|nr:DUF2804 domain-containing protein [Oscillospiraceae bacterium]
MSKQQQITAPTPLLDENGNLTKPGYCKRNLFIYNRENITASRWRVKEWDFYQTSDGEHMIQLNFFNISYGSCITATYLNLRTGERFDDMTLEPLTVKKNPLNRNGDKPYHFRYSRSGREVTFDVGSFTRHLHFSGKAKGKPMEIDLTCEMLLNHESITIATPFDKKGHFFYTNKINCMPTSGTVRIGDREITLDKSKTFTVLDWGRGVWPHDNYWYWANGSTNLDGKLFGFELTWGFGDESNATETAIFYDGKCHKIGAVTVENDPEIGDSWMKPWHFLSEDGRFDMTMIPYYDNYTYTKIIEGHLGMKTHQVHGLWSGKAVLDDGTVLEIKDMYAFCEKVHNQW